MVTSTTQERRSDSHQQIRDLVSSRTDTLCKLSELASCKPFKPNRKTQHLLQEFCESLIDYTASAHFQLYRFIDERKERRKPVLDVAENIYPQIVTITQRILDFNDKYDCEDHCTDLLQLERDLSFLGEMLADRIELEDKLIGILTRSRSN